MKRQHEVVQTSTAKYPSDNGWIVYYCGSCEGVPLICARTFEHNEDGWSEAVDSFNAAHPHTEVREIHWAQPH